MPLVVPELAAGSNDEWLNKLVGKKISESGTSDVTVCCLFPFMSLLFVYLM